MRRFVSVVGFLGVVSIAAPGWAQNDRTTPLDDGTPLALPPHPAVVAGQLAVPPPTLVNSHILYLNNCRPNGCKITRDLNGDDSRTDHSAIAPASGTLKALSASVNFDTIKSCVASALAPFNIQVTDVDPGTAEHFEIMIAGSPTEIGFDAGFEGVAQYLCGGAPGQCFGTYIPNAVTFAFANAYPSSSLMCGVALQETAHGWTLDHATSASDPMTYKTYTLPLSFRDNAPCGSDCIYANGTQNAFGVPCSGTNLNGTHVCMETGTATQNEVQILTKLFGPAGAQPPTVTITAPANGAGIQIGTAFPVTATCTSPDGIQEIDFLLDGTQWGTSTSSPAMFTAPSNYPAGTHHIKVICGTNKQATAAATADILIGNLCAIDADCGGGGKICYQMTCVAGPDATGGLGSTCTGNGDCASGQCGNDGSQSLCVIPCDPANSACPAGFGCLGDGAGGGVCWLGADSGGGCCETGHGDSRGSILFGLGFAALWITRRRK